MDKQIEKVLQNFDAVWQRVTASKAESAQGGAKGCSKGRAQGCPKCCAPLMPRRNQKKPGRRFECGR